MQQDLPVQIRPAKPEDHHYILATWSKRIVKEHPFKSMTSDVWRKHHAIMEHWVKNIGDVLIACNPEEPWSILGYVVASKKDRCIHWLYVKKMFRSLGIGSTLVRALDSTLLDGPVTYTHMCKDARSLGSIIQMKYDPFLFWFHG